MQRQDVKVNPFAVDGFVPSKRDYGRQYASLYWTRLEMFRQLLTDRIANDPELSTQTVMQKVADVQVGARCILIGTVYMDMPMKPNVLTDLVGGTDSSNGVIQVPSLKHTSYASHDDVCTLEDLSGRITLTGASNELICTGIVCAVLGSETDRGLFKVEQCVYPGLHEVPERPLQTQDQLVLLVSGLDCMNCQEHNQQLEMLMSFIDGDFGSEQARKISRVIVVGDSFARDRSQLTQKDGAMTMALGRLQEIVARLNRTVDVDLMPGAHDPTTFLLPQRPIHKGMLMGADAKRKGQASLSRIHCRSNPCALDVGGCKLLATSGQNVDDLMRYLPEDSHMTRLRIACRMIEWRHIAPSAPDTLACYPYVDNDPFALLGGRQEDGMLGAPNVLVLGNQPEYGSDIVKTHDGKGAVRVVLVPSFATSLQVVLLNLRDLSTTTVQF